MAVIVVYDPTDLDVADRVTGYHPSANTPDFDAEPNKLINPDLSGVAGVPVQYWKRSGSTVVEMSAGEKTAADSYIPTGEYDDKYDIVVRNESGSTIVKGSPVYDAGIDGVSGQTLIGISDADDFGKLPVIGIITDDIANNHTGAARTDKKLKSIDTSAWAKHDILYPAVGGGITNVMPDSNQYYVQEIATVKKSEIDGEIDVELETMLPPGKIASHTHQEEDITDLDNYAVIGGNHHNTFSDYDPDEHLDWTSNQGDDNIHKDNITEASVTQHEDALSITESQISDLDKYTQAQVDAKTWDANDIDSGTFADARISKSSVTQYEDDLSITESQISDLDKYTQAQVDAKTWDASDIVSGIIATARVPNLAASKITSGTFANARISQSSVTQHETALSITESQISDLGSYGDVSAGAMIADNAIVRGNGGVKGVQDSAWTIDDSGRMAFEGSVTEAGPPFTSDHFAMHIHNTATSGGGGLFIQAGEFEDDIAFRIMDENKSFFIVDVHADDGAWVFGGGFTDTKVANGVVYGFDNQYGAGTSADFNTQNGTYRIGGNPISMYHLNDVTITANSAGELLLWNGSAWVNNTLAEAGIAASSHTHAAGDINSGSFANARISENSVIQHQAALSITESQISDLGSYITGISNINGIGDVNVGTPGVGENGYVLQWDNSAGEFNLTTVAGGVTDLNGLSDVNVGTPGVGENGYVLQWDNGAGVFNLTTVAGGVTDINGLSDVNVGTPGAGDDGKVLQWDNGAGVFNLATSGGGASALNNLTDVTLTSPVTDDVLIYNGSNWVNESIEQGGADTTLNSWTLVSGDLYRADFAHNLGTQCIATFITDTATDKEVRPEDIEVIDDNTIRVFVRGNSHSLKVCTVTGRGPRGPQGPAGSGIANVVEDTTPQLGGNLDMNGKNIEGVTPTEMGYVSGVTSSIQTQINSHSHTMRLPHTWAISGDVAVPSGDTDYILPFFVSLASGQTAKLVKARHRINSGTSVTCKLQKNGSDVTGFTGISVNTTASNTDPADVTLANDDMIALVVTGVSGSPKNMTFTLFVEYEN